MSLTLVLHSKSQCPWCDQAKKFLNAIPIPYAVVLHDDEADRNKFYDSLTSGDRFVPQILIRDHDGEILEISGFGALKLSGINSLKDQF